MNELLKLVTTLKLSKSGKYKILDGENLIAIVHLDIAKVWSVIDVEDYQNYDVSQWILQPTIASLNPADGVNLKQWLWCVSAKSHDLLGCMINNKQHFFLEFWVKPECRNRKKVVALQTTIAKASCSIDDIMQKTGLTYNDVVHILSRLIFSGYLSKESYENLSCDNKHKSNFIVNKISQLIQNIRKEDSPLDALLTKRAKRNDPQQLRQDIRSDASLLNELLIKRAEINSNNDQGIVKNIISRLRHKLKIYL